MLYIFREGVHSPSFDHCNGVDPRKDQGGSTRHAVKVIELWGPLISLCRQKDRPVNSVLTFSYPIPVKTNMSHRR